METTLKVLDRSISLLEYLVTQKEGVRPAELATHLQIPKSTLQRITNTLEARGLITRNPLTSEYRLGPQLLHFSRAYLENIDYRTTSHEVMRKLRDTTKETISLYIRKKDIRVCIEQLEGLEPLRSSIQVGDVLPLVSGAAGKVLLAFSYQTRVEVPTETLENIRNKGYATSHAEYQEGVSSVSAPVFDFHGNIIAALVISGPSSRFKDAHLEKMTVAVIEGAKEISQKLGYQP